MKNALLPKTFFVVFILFHAFSMVSAQKQITIDSLNKILTLKKTNDTLHIRALNDLAWIYAKTDSAKAMGYALRAKSAAMAKSYTLGLAEAYKAMGTANAYKNNTTLAVQNFTLSNEYYAQLNNKREIGGNYNNMGMAYKLVGNLDQGLAYFLKAEKIHRTINDVEAMGADANNIGAVYADLGSYTKAITYYLEAIRLTENTKKSNQNAQTFINIANILRLQKNYKEGIIYSEKAIKILIDVNDQMNLGIAYLNFANIYIEQSAYDKAIHLIDQSAIAFKKANFKRGLQVCYNNMGALYIRQEKYKQAIPLLEQSIQIVEESKNYAGLALVQQNIAFSYTKLGEFKLAEEWFDKAELSAKKYNKADINTIAEIYSHRSSLDSATGDFKKAFFGRDRFRVIKDSLLNEKLSKQINELNTKYQTEKKQNQIVALTSQNQIQSLQLQQNKLEILNQSLTLDKSNLQINAQNLLLERNRSALNQKKLEAMAKEQKIKLLNTENQIQKLELLKRNITIIIIAGLLCFGSLIGFLFYNKYKLKQEARLQSEVIKQQDLSTKAVLNAEENERRRISGELHDGLGQMFSAVKMNLSALTENLSFKDEHAKDMFDKTMNLVDESCKEVRVISHQMAPNVLLKSGLTAAVRDFISKIDSRRLKINLETFGLQNRLDQNIETVLYRVIQETVNNVIKHAEANILDIQLTKDDDGINAMIEDNGKGFDIKSIEKFEGIGLRNIQSRVAYLKGTVDFSSDSGSGTLVAIYIPL